jgi:hypothetical protein
MRNLKRRAVVIFTFLASGALTVSVHAQRPANAAPLVWSVSDPSLAIRSERPILLVVKSLSRKAACPDYNETSRCFRILPPPSRNATTPRENLAPASVPLGLTG